MENFVFTALLGMGIFCIVLFCKLAPLNSATNRSLGYINIYKAVATTTHSPIKTTRQVPVFLLKVSEVLRFQNSAQTTYHKNKIKESMMHFAGVKNSSLVSNCENGGVNSKESGSNIIGKPDIVYNCESYMPVAINFMTHPKVERQSDSNVLLKTGNDLHSIIENRI